MTLPAGTKVMGHDERLGQVFRNLIDNAISFSPEGGTIAITARKHHAFARVTVEDNGPGIPPDNLESIFERFYTERPGDHFGKNSGLGLSIARQITQNAGGRIWAENRPSHAKAKPAAARALSSNCRWRAAKLKAANIHASCVADRPPAACCSWARAAQANRIWRCG